MPASPEVTREAVEREAIVAELWTLWQDDSQTHDLQFTNPTDLCQWVVRRLLAEADGDRREPADAELRTIADGVSRLVGRHS